MRWGVCVGGLQLLSLVVADKSSTHAKKIEIIFIINIFAQSVVLASEGIDRKTEL